MKVLRADREFTLGQELLQLRREMEALTARVGQLEGQLEGQLRQQPVRKRAAKRVHPHSVLGMRLREARELLGRTQSEFANDLGVSQSQLWKWEAGVRRPKLDRLRAIADRLKVSLDHLLGRD